LPDSESEIFFAKGLDSFLLICPSGALLFSLSPFFTGRGLG
jgi:hypothetical protein